jgi:hypothetical protein
MRLVEFTQVIFQKSDDNTVNMGKGTVLINPELICTLTPAQVPSNIAGPDGSPVPAEGCIIGMGSRNVLVDVSISEVLVKCGFIQLNPNQTKHATPPEDQNESQEPKIIKLPGVKNEQ